VDELLELTDSTFDDEVIEQDEFLKLVYFYYPWLNACREDLEILDEFIDRFKERVQFFKINIDKCPRVSSRYFVRNEPTIIIFNKGEEAKRISGEINEEEVKIEIDDLIESLKKIKEESRKGIRDLTKKKTGRIKKNSQKISKKKGNKDVKQKRKSTMVRQKKNHRRR